MRKYPSKSRRNSFIESVKRGFEHSLNGEGKWLVVAGRVVGKYDDVVVVQDESGRISVDCQEGCGDVGIGDIIEVVVGGRSGVGDSGVFGVVGSEELFSAKEISVLSKCHDEFYIGVGSANYKKLVIDRNKVEVMKKRALVLDQMRAWFKGRDFLEVETPSLVKLPGMEPYLDVFGSKFVSEGGKAEEMYLITSPEYFMKKLLVGGMERIFQICKSFRNKETESTLHNPEFTMIEWYRAFADYEDIMRDTEEMVSALAVAVNGKAELVYGGARVDVGAPWLRLKVKNAFKQYAGIEYRDFEDERLFRERAVEKGYNVDENTSFDDVFFLIFMNEIEPRLGFEKPVILYEYPVSMASLSNVCEADSRYAQRFEVYIAGVELCNAFTELNDPFEQEKRLGEEREERIKLGKEVYDVDRSFISALKFGMSPAGGIALGVDRLVMLLTGVSDIRDVIFFPHRDL